MTSRVWCVRLLPRGFRSATLVVVLNGTMLAGSLGGEMRLKDEGTFFVGNKMITTNPGDVSINGVYVHFRIPVDRRSPWPVIMVHGSGTGITYETTPDGREGWATYFVRQGYAVYVIDAAGRGRSGFNGTRVNQAKAEGNLAAVPNLVATTHREVWQRSRFGPEPYVWWPDTQFPTDALQQYLAQLVPLAESTLEGGEDNTSNGLAVLLDKIGPSVMIVHSLGANYARRVLSLRPGKIKALIDLEGRMLCTPQPNTEEIKSSFVPVPFLLVAGDRGWAGEPVCRPAIAAIRAAGGNATYMHLPDKGLKGNTHLMMMDKNNLKVADVILGWIAENVRSRS